MHRRSQDPRNATHAVPGLRGRQVIAATPEDAARALADHVVKHLARCLEDAPTAHLALSGGSSGALVCDALAASQGLDSWAWARVHVWMVDERCVPDDDPRLNFALVRDRLAPRVGIPSDHLHPMPVALADGASRYQHDLDVALSATAGRLDAVVLGMGADGHTASLFPHSPALAETARLVTTNDGDTVAAPRPRMTLTFPTLGRARLLAVLVAGASKSRAMGALIAGAADPLSLPIAGVTPGPDAELVWYLDQAALPPVG